MIIIYEELGDVFGYYHDGIAHINESLLPYMKEHVRKYLEYFHIKGMDSGEIKLRTYFDKRTEYDAEAYRHANTDWSGEVSNHMTEEEIAHLVRQTCAMYPECKGMTANEIVEFLINKIKV